jgi:iron complex outermembrane receptor protein
MKSSKSFNPVRINRLSYLITSSVISLMSIVNVASAQNQDSIILSSNDLKKLSLEELMNIEVTSISNRPEKLTEVASAVQVITGKDINRSSAIRLPEALRLASNLQITQANSHDWGITSRGFNGLPSAGGILANKLLVLIDGRSVYSPLFGGVYWDAQNTLLEDIDRIEVVSGPGGTLWGANAVNGVINIKTKSARETQGFYFSGTVGTFLQDHVELRSGVKIDSNIFLRVYAQHFDQYPTVLDNGTSAYDRWKTTQGGFRMDAYPSGSTVVTLQSNFYEGTENKGAKFAKIDGQNILSRFTHNFSDKSDVKIQIYFDRTWRETPNGIPTPFNYELKTYDVDLQHRFSLGKNQSIVYGLAYRLQADRASKSLVPLNRQMPLYSAFIQDEISYRWLKLTFGSKFLDNIFSGFEYQPSARIAITPNAHHTVWTAVSRSVRTPSRFDADLLAPVKFRSEKVIAYELGYRVRPVDQLSLSLATFYNDYTDLRSLNSYPSPTVVLANSQRAESYGAEMNGTLHATEWWQLRFGYTYFKKNLFATDDHVLPVSKEFEGVDPENQFMLQSIMDVTKELGIDLTCRYIDELPKASLTLHIPAYFAFDIHIAYHFNHFEISIAGQNLLEEHHNETGASRIPRSIYGKIALRF